MYSVTIPCAPEDKELLIAELWDVGTEGIVEGDAPGGPDLRAFFNDRETAMIFARRYGVEVQEEEDRDWQAEMREGWEAFPAGDRFWLAPSWRTEPAPDGRFRIEINPGLAFGTGRHETTLLCIEAIESVISPNQRVLDLGTGSGILAIAAALLGAGRVYACDIDTEAVPVARDNFRTAGMEIGTFAGSLRSVASGSLDVVIANINAVTLSAIALDLIRILKPGGIAVTSGFRWDERGRVGATMSRLGMRILEERQKGPWGCLVLAV